jgi:membrane protease YdiL (CAAX protease family)
VIFLYFFSQGVAAAALGLYAGLHHWTGDQIAHWLNNSITVQFVYSLLADGVLVLGVALILRVLKWRWSTIGLTKPKLWHLLIVIVAAVGYYLILIIAVAVVSALIPSFNPAQKQDIGFQAAQGTAPLILTFISLAVLPPLAEELTMRGLLYTGLRRWLPKIVAALAVSALFASAHLVEGGAAGPLWVGALDTFILSMVLIALREITGNLWAGIALHAVKNTVAFATLFLIMGR